MQSRGKKSNLKIGVTYITLGVFLLACLIGGLYVWYAFLPAFVDLIICLGVVFSLLIVYFLLLRGVFLSKNSGFDITEEFLIYKDGYPNSKQYTLKLKDVTFEKIKPYKFAFILTATIIFTIILALAIVLCLLLKLKLIITLLIILGGIVISGYFVSLHFISLSLAKCKIFVSGKKIILRNLTLQTLQSLKEKCNKGGVDEI